jgi:hypothetical protein
MAPVLIGRFGHQNDLADHSASLERRSDAVVLTSKSQLTATNLNQKLQYFSQAVALLYE